MIAFYSCSRNICLHRLTVFSAHSNPCSFSSILTDCEFSMQHSVSAKVNANVDCNPSIKMSRTKGQSKQLQTWDVRRTVLYLTIHRHTNQTKLHTTPYSELTVNSEIIDAVLRPDSYETPWVSVCTHLGVYVRAHTRELANLCQLRCKIILLKWYNICQISGLHYKVTKYM